MFWLLLFLLMGLGLVSGQQVRTSTTLSSARTGLSATATAGLVLFAGGITDLQNTVSTVDILNGTTGKWLTSVNLSQARAEIAATSINTSSSSLALFGGGAIDGTQFFATVDIYNATSGKWTMASLSQSRFNLAATTVGEVALFAGGSRYGTYYNQVDMFNASSGTWTLPVGNLSVARGNLVATAIRDLAIFAGGIAANDETVSVVDIFNVTSGNWTTATLSYARASLAAATVGDVALFAGGGFFNKSSSGPISNMVDIFNVSSGQWSTATLSSARSQISAVSVGGIMAVFAGGSTSLTATVSVPTVDIFLLSTQQWTNATLSFATSASVAASWGSLAFIGGGTYNSSLNNQFVDIFNINAIPLASPSARPSTSNSPVPHISPITYNARSSFNTTAPVVNLTTSLSSNINTTTGTPSLNILKDDNDEDMQLP